MTHKKCLGCVPIKDPVGSPVVARSDRLNWCFLDHFLVILMSLCFFSQARRQTEGRRYTHHGIKLPPARYLVKLSSAPRKAFNTVDCRITHECHHPTKTKRDHPTLQSIVCGRKTLSALTLLGPLTSSGSRMGRVQLVQAPVRDRLRRSDPPPPSSACPWLHLE